MLIWGLEKCSKQFVPLSAGVVSGTVPPSQEKFAEAFTNNIIMVVCKVRCRPKVILSKNMEF